MSCAVACWPPLAVAVIVAVPGATPVAEHELPFAAAVAMLEFELLQLERVGTGDPPVMLTENDVEAPTFTEAVVGENVTTTAGGFWLTNPSPPPPHDATVVAHAITAAKLYARFILEIRC